MARIDTSSLKPLTKTYKTKYFKTGDITQKVAATVVFNSELVNQINNEQKPRIQYMGLKMLATYFEAYVDNLARTNHSKYHHIYEPGRTGEKNARLFESSITEGKKPVLSYNFTESKYPVSSGHVFTNKAYIMENVIPLKIKAREADYLVFEYEGEFYSKKSVFVPQPGGPDVGGAFTETFNTFMTTMGDKALADLGFFERIEKGIANESRVTLARVSAGKIEGMAAQAAASALKIAKGLK